MDIPKLLAHIQDCSPDLLAVYLFGSQITGRATAESDVDLAVLLAGSADPLQLWRLSGELADIAGLPVDLLDLRAASTVMQYQILTSGQRIWAKDAQAGIFESFILSVRPSRRFDMVSKRSQRALSLCSSYAAGECCARSCVRFATCSIAYCAWLYVCNVNMSVVAAIAIIQQPSPTAYPSHPSK